MIKSGRFDHLSNDDSKWMNHPYILANKDLLDKLSRVKRKDARVDISMDDVVIQVANVSLGGGTTAVCSVILDRRFIGNDVDADAVDTSALCLFMVKWYRLRWIYRRWFIG